jgi:hypothetical protein
MVDLQPFAGYDDFWKRRIVQTSRRRLISAIVIPRSGNRGCIPSRCERSSEVIPRHHFQYTPARLVPSITEALRSGIAAVSTGVGAIDQLHSCESDIIRIIELQIGFSRIARAEAGQRVIQKVEARKLQLYIPTLL